jgi:16S rRNA (cytosine967-C5)-methyltransferase
MNKEQVSPKGLEVRRLAAVIFQTVLSECITLDDAVAREVSVEQLEPRDRSFLLLLLLTTFRRLGEIDAVIATYLSKPLPRKSGNAGAILRLAACQLLFLETPAHAAIDLAVRCARADRNATHFSGLLNAVLRKLATGGKALLAELDAPRLNTSDWLWQRWTKSYGNEECRAIASAHASEPLLDIAVKSNPEMWAEKLGGLLLLTGHVRLPPEHPPMSSLPGFADGGWWVQDAAAGIPVLLFGDLSGKRALDLCAAPGGKTMQMAAAGAEVTSVDISESRLARLRENLTRTGLKADVHIGDVLSLGITEAFDAVLLDAPCSATGTIRRHPELPYIRTGKQMGELRALQRMMLRSAAERVKPGGRLVYCTCSLEPEEGESQVKWFLAGHPEFTSVSPKGLPSHLVQPEGWVRTLPCMSLGQAKGMDGFFAALLQRSGV